MDNYCQFPNEEDEQDRRGEKLTESRITRLQLSEL